MALISEVVERIYEIKPEGKELENFPQCTVYLILDDNTALEEIVNRMADVLVKGSILTKEDYLASSPYFRTLMIEGYRQLLKKKNMV